MSKQIDKDLIIRKMTERLTALEDRSLRDFSGGIQSDVFAIRELKHWKEAIQRNEFDMKEDTE
jgi:hypothetical protein